MQEFEGIYQNLGVSAALCYRTGDLTAGNQTGYYPARIGPQVSVTQKWRKKKSAMRGFAKGLYPRL
tara:strand:+ start:85 stop:282 length:198 start_codon:yes stop_codon:yes gene_type:complete